MDCIKNGRERKASRVCNLPPCETLEDDIINNGSFRTTKVRNADNILDNLTNEGRKKNCKCGQFGECELEKQSCICHPGWSGDYCDEPICHPTCHNGGICSRPDVCACKSGYTGARCQEGLSRYYKN